MSASLIITSEASFKRAIRNVYIVALFLCFLLCVLLSGLVWPTAKLIAHMCVVAQVCRDGLDAHSARVAELRAMVAEIADEIGCDAADLLRGEVDALGRRLESVRESISTLADIAEAQAANRTECGRSLEQAKSYLSGMQEVSVWSGLRWAENRYGGEELTGLAD